MMPVVRINDATFEGLKVISKWIETETPSQTIDRLVVEMMKKLDLERDTEGEVTSISVGNKPMEFERTPGLSFTRILGAKVNGREISRPNWAGVLFEIISVVKQKVLTPERLAVELDIPTKRLPWGEGGYTFYVDLGISYQGQSATDAWKEISRLSDKWDIPVVIELEWRENPKAQFPGKRGILRRNAGI